jgi:hypothetical protein
MVSTTFSRASCPARRRGPGRALPLRGSRFESVIIPPHVSGQARALDRGHMPQDIGDLCLQQLQLVAGLRKRTDPSIAKPAACSMAAASTRQDVSGHRRNSAGRDPNEVELSIVDDDAHHNLDQGPFGARTTVDRPFLW